jgi:hypothetical protein
MFTVSEVEGVELRVSRKLSGVRANVGCDDTNVVSSRWMLEEGVENLQSLLECSRKPDW